MSNIKSIIKRDGREVPFEPEKITNAIFAAAGKLGGHNRDTAEGLTEQVIEYLETVKNITTPTVEEVQDVVEKILIENGHAATAKEYILYRAERTRVRDMNTKLMKIYEDLTFRDAAENDIKRENANIDGDTSMGTMLKYGSEGAKEFNEIYVLDPKHADAHIKGDIHIHDLDFLTLTTTCTQIDLTKLFKDGFSTGHGFIREPNDIQTYAALACIAIQSNQNDQHGGQSIPDFEYAMAPGVRKTFVKKYRDNLAKFMDVISAGDSGNEVIRGILDEIREESGLQPTMGNADGFEEKLREKLANVLPAADVDRALDFTRKMTDREIRRATYQAMEAVIHNLNTMHSRAGAQIPFSSINYGTDTSPEGRLVIENILKAQYDGLGHGETPIFPIHIFKVKEGVNYNPEDPNYDLFKLAIQVSAKRLFPNFSFLDAPFNAQYYQEGHPDTEVAYMGCRTRVIANAYDRGNEKTPGRGNLSFTSINLPRIAIKAKGDIDIFFEDLDRKLSLCFDQLYDRYKIQAARKVKNYPFLMGQGIWTGSENLSQEDEVGEILKNGTLTVGFIGLAECLKALIGSHHGESQEAQNLGLDIIGFMRKRADEKTKATGMNYTLIATPAEGLSGRFVKIDREKYGEIPGVTDREYYTNSFHVPVYYEINAFDKVKLEAPYHALTNGGHISYIEMDGDPQKNLDAFEAVVRCMKESGIGYGSINHPVDRDPVCGFTGIIDNECPCCHRTEADGQPNFERIRRITGYLVGTLDRFNNAKKAEVRDRVKHSVVKQL